MGRPYSQDLRERVVEAAAVTSRRQAAAHFGVGIATSIRRIAEPINRGASQAYAIRFWCPNSAPVTSSFDKRVIV